MPTTPSPVTPSEVEGTIPESTGSICTKLTSLWSLANLMFEFFDWFLNDDGTLSDEGLDFLAGASVPVGSMVHWPMDVAPDGWVTANGAVVSRTGVYENLFNVSGVKYGAGDGSTTFGLPDCRRMFLFGASGTNVAGSTGGAEEVTLLRANLPAILPELKTGIDGFVMENTASGTHGLAAGSNISKLAPEDALELLGSDEPVDILNPYFSAHVIIKL